MVWAGGRGDVTPPQVDDVDFLQQRSGGAASAAG